MIIQPIAPIFSGSFSVRTIVSGALGGQGFHSFLGVVVWTIEFV